MSAQLFREQDYSGTASRPAHYFQSLWKVSDIEFYKPGERFISDESPFLESVVNQGISGPLESAPIPKGLVTFVEDLIRSFAAVPSKYSSIDTVIARVMTLLDFTEPYFLFVGSAVQLTSNQLKSTYRVKKTGSVLAPESIECFGISRSYNFDQFKAASDFLKHPAVKAVLNNERVQHQTENRAITKDDVLDKLSEILFGDPPSLRATVEEWIFNHYQETRVSGNLNDEELLQLDTEGELDIYFWSVAAISVLMWLKGPYAIRFLSEYHPIYAALLRWDDRTGRVVSIPESGGEAIVDGWCIYTHRDLIVETNTPPGTCESCKQSLHCTKFVNAQALFHSECSCGKAVAIDDLQFSGHSWNAPCGPYLERYPPFNAFVCQRCLNMALFKLDPKVAKCARTHCPATKCPHHAGQKAYVHELTKRRAQLLTHRPV